MGDFSSLKAALSEDKSLAAVAVPSSDRRVIQVYQIENGLLQTTLTAKSPARRKSASKPENSFDRVLFCGNNYVIALTKPSSDKASGDSSSQVFVWDLSRGGVVAHTIADESNHKQYLDAAVTSEEHLYLLVAVSSTGSRRSSASGIGNDSDEGKHANKLQVHQYEPSSGRLVRKIKCGKCSGTKNSEFGLAVQETFDGKTRLLVRNGTNSHHEAFRVVDAETGSKIAKHKYRESKNQAKKDGTGGGGILVAGPIVAIPRLSCVVVYNIESHKWMKTIPSKSSNPQVQLWSGTEDEGPDSTSMLLVDEKLFKCYSNSVDPLTNVHSDQSLSLLPRSTHQVAAVLYNPEAVQANIQVHPIAWGRDNPTETYGVGLFQTDVTINWQSPEDMSTSATEQGGSSKKRNAESLTLLGAGQAGGEKTGVSERRDRKKHKQQTPGENEERRMVVADDPSMKNMTIADRLKKLSEVMETKAGEDAESSDDELYNLRVKRDNGVITTNFVPKRATTDSLTQLLTQALQGGDDGLLELALSVRDKNVLEETVKGLNSFHVELLMTKLTTRIASKPQRAEDLSRWLSRMLESGKVRKMNQMQLLKNLLQERIDTFEHLLRLEGRLSMVNAKKKARADKNKLSTA